MAEDSRIKNTQHSTEKFKTSGIQSKTSKQERKQENSINNKNKHNQLAKNLVLRKF